MHIASWFHRGIVNLESPAPIVASVPKLGRDLVWNPVEIEGLWDSLLSGSSIGTLVVCPRIPGQDDGDDASVTHHLLDGLQRSHTLAMGFQDPFAAPKNPSKLFDHCMLWIDLQPEISSDVYREFLVRLTTSAHPWGFRCCQSGILLHPAQIREFLNHAGLDPSSPDYVQPGPSDLFPAEAAVPIPLSWLTCLDAREADEFWNMLLQRCQSFDAPWSAKVRDFLIDSSTGAAKARRSLFEAMGRLRNLQIFARFAPNSLIPPTRSKTSQSAALAEESAIEKLSQRLSLQGTRLDSEELACSLIKAYWPQLANPIQEIMIRRMPASRLVMVASRAAITQPGSNHLASPLSVSDIRRLAWQRDDKDNPVVDFIENWLELCCKWIESILLFNPKSNPGGMLPGHLAQIARATPEAYLLMLCLARRDMSPSSTTCESMDTLGPALFKLFCRMAWFATDAHQTANHALYSCGDGSVTSAAILHTITHAEQEGWLLALPSPDELSLLLDFDGHDTVTWTWHSPIHGDGEQDGIDIRQRRWGAILQRINNPDLLLFAQREFLARKFSDFDPSRQDLWEGRNLPWDFDHINATTHVENTKGDARYQPFVKQWLDTIGNLRAWPIEDNLSDSTELANAKIVSPEQLSDSFMLPGEVPAFSMGRKTLVDETAAREFAEACCNRLIRIYRQCWNQIH